MRTQLIHDHDGHCYVQLDQFRVPFHDEAQARAYLTRLEQRLAAPHMLPGAGQLSGGRRRHS